MNGRYVVYWRLDATEEGDRCDHSFKGFDTITEAVEHFNNLNCREKYILKLVTWKTEITDVTEGI